MIKDSYTAKHFLRRPGLEDNQSIGMIMWYNSRFISCPIVRIELGRVKSAVELAPNIDQQKVLSVDLGEPSERLRQALFHFRVMVMKFRPLLV